MYRNVFGEKVSRWRYKEMLNAAKNRRELIAAGLTGRRDLLKMGLLTASGMLVAKGGLSARAQTAQTASSAQGSPGSFNVCLPGNQAASPRTRAFIEPLPIMPLARTVPASSLSPAPTIAPNTAGGEVRAASHQAPLLNSGMFPFPPPRVYQVRQHAIQVSQSPDLPVQTIWGFDDGFHATSPGPTYLANYGIPQLVRNINALPPANQNGGFGLPSVTTHLHNGHTPSESDGNPCDFYPGGNFCDQYYPNVLAGFNSDHSPTGDVNESLSTLWYHDHRVDFTSQNTYKGLLGFYCLFNEFDTGDESTGFHLPSFPQFDIPLAFADKVYDPSSGLLAFDLFNLDGILGDKFLVNGKIQPFFRVQPRRYRFRLLDTGPSRFYQFFLTDPSNMGAQNPFFVIANDGNLLPAPVKVSSVRIGVAERVDIIIDFKNFAGKTVYLENRLRQINGMGPVPPQGLVPGQVECSDAFGNLLSDIVPAGQGNLLLQFRVSGNPVSDGSADPNIDHITYYQLPDTTATPRVTRTFKFDRLNGQWSINGQFMDCDHFRFRVQQNSVENWILFNATGDWTHPIHIHLEEHQILSRNRVPPPLAVEQSRKDVTQLHQNERVLLFFRFRDWLGKYPIHCHNVIHEDHAMMGLWNVEPQGDTVLVP
ncbi:MAG TPA: multicopper oxidase domain-containing protein [Vicinamibacterales bacterium]|nr:multicopper oxidase domain-containing protein [Vicinamibacterales bacterium]